MSTPKFPPKIPGNTRKTACARLWGGLGAPNDQSNSRRIPGAAHLNEGSIRRETMEGLTTGCGPLPWRIHPFQDLGLVILITYLLVSPQDLSTIPGVVVVSSPCKWPSFMA